MLNILTFEVEALLAVGGVVSLALPTSIGVGLALIGTVPVAYGVYSTILRPNPDIDRLLFPGEKLSRDADGSSQLNYLTFKIDKVDGSHFLRRTRIQPFQKLGRKG
jgi:hypothetical protein